MEGIIVNRATEILVPLGGPEDKKLYTGVFWKCFNTGVFIFVQCP